MLSIKKKHYTTLIKHLWKHMDFVNFEAQPEYMFTSSS